MHNNIDKRTFRQMLKIVPNRKIYENDNAKESDKLRAWKTADDSRQSGTTFL